jgi:acetyl-CoA acetyltransferase family protein
MQDVKGTGTRVAIVGGCRTPFVKAGGAFGERGMLALSTHVVGALIDRLTIEARTVDEIVFGTVLLDPRLPNLAREIVLRTTLPDTISAHSVSNNCITGLVAASMISDGIRAGRIRRGIAGGAESMSRPTLTLREDAERFFLSLSRAKTVGDRLALLKRFRPGLLVPQPPSPKEPSTGLTMGQHCELMAKEFRISRTEQDEIALRSHRNAAASAAVLAQEIAPFDGVTHDNLVRSDTSMEKLAKLAPVFDKSGSGTITAGNASALTDGASAVYLMAEAEAKREGRKILAYLEGVEFAAIDPADGLLMAPVIALPRLLKRHNLSVSDIDLFEVHEAFGAQVVANMKAWRDGWSKYPGADPIGDIPVDRMNVQGGSIAVGHPFAATGGRLLTSLAHALDRKGLTRGVISICAAGAMAGAALLTRE